MSPTKPRRVLGYARVSSDQQTRGESLALQEQAIIAHARALGLKMKPKMFVEAESGSYEKLEKRLQMQALMREAREGDLIICDKLDRWSRDVVFTHQSMRDLRAKNVSVYFVGDHLDPMTDAGEQQLGYMSIGAQAELKRIRVRLVGNRSKLRDRGYFTEGQPPPGYKRKRSAASAREEKLSAEERLEVYELAVDERAAKVVKRVFASAIAGKSIGRIVADHDGVEWGSPRMIRGKERPCIVDENFVRLVLKRRFYTGKTRTYGGEWIGGKHPKIVDELTFVKAQAALKARSLGGARPRGEGETSSWWLRDVARCGYLPSKKSKKGAEPGLCCGARMGSGFAGEKGTKQRLSYYRCSARLAGDCHAPYIAVEDVEKLASPFIPARLEQLKFLLSKPHVEAPEKSVGEKLAALARRRERARKSFAIEGKRGEAWFAKEIEAIDAEETKLESERPAASPLADPKKRAKVLDAVEETWRLWKKADPRSRRAIVNLLATSVRMVRVPGKVRGDDDVQVEFIWKPVETLALGDLAAQFRGG